MQKSILYALLVSAVLHNSTFSWDFPWQERSMKVFSDQRGQVIAEPKKHHDERAEKFMDVVQQALKNVKHHDYIQVEVPDNGKWDCRKLEIGGRPNHEVIFECRQKNPLAALLMLFSFAYDGNTITTRTTLQKTDK